MKILARRSHAPVPAQHDVYTTDVSIAVGALRKRERIKRRNRGHDPLLQLLFLSVGESSSINLHNLLAIGQKCSTLSCNKNSNTEE